jgi:hypothetical protein
MNEAQEPLIHPDFLPSSYGQGDREADLKFLQALYVAPPAGYQAQGQLLWDATRAVLDVSEEDQTFVEEIKAAFVSGIVFRTAIAKSTIFYCPAAASYRAEKSRHFEVRLLGPPVVQFDGLEVYILPPIQLRTGRYSGGVLSLVVAAQSFVVTCLQSTQVTASFPEGGE